VERGGFLGRPARGVTVALEVERSEPERAMREPASDVDHRFVDAELPGERRDAISDVLGQGM
jgi:hypothetical protein